MSRLGFLAWAAFGLLVPTAARAQPVDVVGTWHVLVHYKDSAVTNEDAERWDDRVWVIERSGEMLRWSEYPIVVLDDETGRFEARRGTRRARKLNYWEPTSAQIAELQQGPRVNDRGSVSKKLRSAGPTAWKSLGGAGPASASVITFVATWSIDDALTLPVFKQADVMGGGLTDSMEGMTLYETQSVEDGGNVLRGRFERDGSRKGTFRLLRTPGPRDLGSEEEQRARIQAREESAFRATIANDPEMRATIRDDFEEALYTNGIFLTKDEVDELIGTSLEMFGQGVAPDQIAKVLEKRAVETYFDFAKSGDTHDDSARYELPFDPSVPRQLIQGINGQFSHKGRHAYAFDFTMPVGTRILAARAGTVARVTDGFTRGGRTKSLMGKANQVTVSHEDGTFATYVHLDAGAVVKPGDTVSVGQHIGNSGNTGYTTGPHLHFAVWALEEDGRARTLPIRFEDGSAGGFVPAIGQYYGKAQAAAN